MELMGQWAPSVQMDQSAGKKGLGDKLGWFAFPTVAGGAGAAADGVGGGNGIAVGCQRATRGDRLSSSSSTASRTRTSSTPTMSGCPRRSARRARVKDPNLQAVLAGRGNAKFMQLYLDQATKGALSQAFNDATIALFLGQSTPAEVCQALTDAAAK
jgi:raffinose/stachyose/melibiose transport system substrate-binding protein